MSSSNQLTLTGSALPNATTTDEITVGPVGCNPSSVAENQIVCNLNGTKVSGNWLAQIRTNKGLVPTQVSDADRINIAVDSTGISKTNNNESFNYLGGDTVVITGNNFGTDASVINVTYADGTVCDVQSVTMTAITCKTRRFTDNQQGTTQAVTVLINTVSQSSQSATLISQAKRGVSMTPASASPVLKSNLTIQLDATYPIALNKSDFKAELFGINDTTYERELYVMSVDDAAKTVKVKFPGAVSGNYKLQLSST